MLGAIVALVVGGPHACMTTMTRPQGINGKTGRPV
jgi:hypothetical protein